MSERPRLESAAAAAALLVCAAFVASFALGLGGRPAGVRQAPQQTEAVDAPSAVGRLEVLNASGRSGMARAATDRLRSAGFDVVYFGNAPSSAGDSSVVIARTGDDAVARAAAAELGMTRITSRPDTALYLDATVVIGTDWRPAPAPRAAPDGGWRARVSRWFGGR